MADLGSIGRNAMRVGLRPPKCVSGAIAFDGPAGDNVLGRRKVLLHQQATGAVVSVNYSFSNGAFSVPSTLAIDGNPHYVVLLDDGDGTALAAEIYSDVYPV